MNNNNIETVIVISGIIGLIYLIALAMLCDNVSQIKKKLFETSTSDYWLNEYNKHRYLANQNEAKTALQNFVWYSMLKNRGKKNYQNLKDKYQKAFENLNAKFPDYPF